MLDNAFLEVSDVDMAQKLSDRINPEWLHKILDVFAKRYCPAAESLGPGYTWTVQQIECATDIMFKQLKELAPLYDEIIKTAIFTVKPDNIATFLGQRITYNCKKEVGTNYNQRILGTRIKHHMGDVSIKMYDKFGHVLRIESICNDISTFRVKHKVEHLNGSSSMQKAPLKKSIYSLYQLFTIMKAANYRYLEFISSFDDHSKGNERKSGAYTCFGISLFLMQKFCHFTLKIIYKCLKLQILYLLQCLPIRLVLSKKKRCPKHKPFYPFGGIFPDLVCTAGTVPIDFKAHIFFE